MKIENKFLKNELMSSKLWKSKVSPKLTRITVGILEDIGYDVDYSKADDYERDIIPGIEDSKYSVQEDCIKDINNKGVVQYLNKTNKVSFKIKDLAGPRASSKCLKTFSFST